MDPHHFSDPFLKIPLNENYFRQVLHFKFYMWCKLRENTVNVAADDKLHNFPVIHAYFWAYSACLCLSAVNSGWTTLCLSSADFLCSSLAAISSGCWCLPGFVSKCVLCSQLPTAFPRWRCRGWTCTPCRPSMHTNTHRRRHTPESESRQMLRKRGTNRIILSCSLS